VLREQVKTMEIKRKEDWKESKITFLNYFLSQWQTRKMCNQNQQSFLNGSMLLTLEGSWKD
jgi:hypothetical protein